MFGSNSGASEIFNQGNFPCGMAMYNARWRSQVFTSWCGEMQTHFLFTEIAVFLMYREIYVYIYLWSLNNLYSILTSVLYKKWSNIVSNSMLRGSGCVLTNSGVSMLHVRQFPWDHVVWFSQSQWLCSKLSQWWIYKMAAFIHAPCWLQTLKEYEIITLIYNRNHTG